MVAISTKSCFAFYNYGNRCFLDLLVAVYSLSKNTDSSIVVFLNSSEKDLSLQEEDLRRVLPQVTIDYFDVSQFPKNTNSVIKPWLAKRLSTTYASFIICDSDLVFLSSIDNMFAELLTHELLLTTQGKTHCGFNNRLRDRITIALPGAIHHTFPYYNIGIMGIATKSPFISFWSDECNRLSDLIDTGAIDETVVNVVASQYNKCVLDSSYNYTTPKLCGQATNLVKVVHFAFNSLPTHPLAGKCEDVLAAIIPLLVHLPRWIVAKG